MKLLVNLAITLIIISSISLYLNHLDKPQAHINHKLDGDVSDLRIRNAQITTYNETGSTWLKIQADSLAHFANGLAELENIILLISTDNEPEWLAIAKTALLDQKKQQMFLFGEVLIEQQDIKYKKYTSVLTANLLIDYKNMVAYSKSKTTLQQTSQLTTGQGIEIAYAHPSRVKLISRVSGSYHFD